MNIRWEINIDIMLILLILVKIKVFHENWLSSTMSLYIVFDHIISRVCISLDAAGTSPGTRTWWLPSTTSPPSCRSPSARTPRADVVGRAHRRVHLLALQVPLLAPALGLRLRLVRLAQRSLHCQVLGYHLVVVRRRLHVRHLVSLHAERIIFRPPHSALWRREWHDHDTRVPALVLLREPLLGI